MKLCSIYLAIAGFTAYANAYVYFLNTNWTGITSDTDLPLHWSGDGTPVNISLMHGPADNMQYVRNITVNNPNSTLIWNPRESHPSGNYSLVINQGLFSFSSPRFVLVGAIARVPATHSVVVTMTSLLGPTDLPKIVIVGREAASTPVVTAAPRLMPAPTNRAVDKQIAAGPMLHKRQGSSSTVSNIAAQTSVVALGTGTAIVAPGAFLLLIWLVEMVAFI